MVWVWVVISRSSLRSLLVRSSRYLLPAALLVISLLLALGASRSVLPGRSGSASISTGRRRSGRQGRDGGAVNSGTGARRQGRALGGFASGERGGLGDDGDDAQGAAVPRRSGEDGGELDTWQPWQRCQRRKGNPDLGEKCRSSAAEVWTPGRHGMFRKPLWKSALTYTRDRWDERENPRLLRT